MGSIGRLFKTGLLRSPSPITFDHGFKNSQLIRTRRFSCLSFVMEKLLVGTQQPKPQKAA
ncbi:hypothetical protein WN73_21255 [Bradyrhizobium sp. CCBAU 45394]|nr:hypothetical protein [Bradyrhizobium sp. CCBAU 45394]